MLAETGGYGSFGLASLLLGAIMAPVVAFAMGLGIVWLFGEYVDVSSKEMAGVAMLSSIVLLLPQTYDSLSSVSPLSMVINLDQLSFLEHVVLAPAFIYAVLGVIRSQKARLVFMRWLAHQAQKFPHPVDSKGDKRDSSRNKKK